MSVEYGVSTLVVSPGQFQFRDDWWEKAIVQTRAMEAGKVTIARPRAAAHVVAKVTFGAFLSLFTFASVYAAVVPLCRPYPSPPLCSLARSVATGTLCPRLRGRAPCRSGCSAVRSPLLTCSSCAAVRAPAHPRKPSPSSAHSLSRYPCGLSRLRSVHACVPCASSLASCCAHPARCILRPALRPAASL